MTPYAATRIPAADQELYSQVRNAVLDLPDNLLDRNQNPIEITCHMLARAVGYAFKLKWHDGYFVSPSHKHSWLTTPHNNIIDVYPIALIGGPVMMDTQCWLSVQMYVGLPLKTVSGTRFNDPLFRQHVAILHHELKKSRRLPLA